jgi:hypothetical protein
MFEFLTSQIMVHLKQPYHFYDCWMSEVVGDAIEGFLSQFLTDVAH